MVASTVNSSVSCSNSSWFRGARIFGAGALAVAGALIADDVTGVGIADDLAVPGIAIVGATALLIGTIGAAGCSTFLERFQPQPEDAGVEDDGETEADLLQDADTVGDDPDLLEDLPVEADAEVADLEVPDEIGPDPEVTDPELAEAEDAPLEGDPEPPSEVEPDPELAELEVPEDEVSGDEIEEEEVELPGPCDHPPSGFLLGDPTLDAPNVPVETLINWGDSEDDLDKISCSDSINYRLRVYSDNICTALVMERPTTESQYQVQPGELAYDTDYYYDAQASDTCPTSVDSTPTCSHFKTAPRCSKIGDDVRITNAGGESTFPSPVWTGSELGVAWEDNRVGSIFEIYFARLAADGIKFGSDVPITSGGNSAHNASLAWTGSEYGVAWQDSRSGSGAEIYFARISATGELIPGSERRITDVTNGQAVNPSLVSTGSELGLAWQDFRDGNEEIYFVRLAADGTKLGTDTRITTNDSYYSGDPSLTWTGSEYEVAWTDKRDGNEEIYFARISAAGELVPGSERRITDDASYSQTPSLVSAGSESGVAWNDLRDGPWEIYFARILNSTGEKLGSDVRVTIGVAAHSNAPSLAWTGSEYAVVWHGIHDGNHEISFKPISAAGVPASEVRVTNNSGTSTYPSLVWTGSGYTVVWQDDTFDIGINNEIFLTFLGCGAP